ncbi:efflux RND transporter periplasmic adaptor subunit [Brevibacillus sp. BC25]|uniref:efflux RND transporter periplasmic adaptor subunit n=1 Tax=Brevibacillus sp. BC25 TaxID=1144308 RepID=UPI00027103E1|nr:efflux RND transporter periplasmic adaptor subunit [Brevibacillus sp. BC25]EJL26529.1 membrane-fusion protein [Brevibacillus sp. BC25]
MNKKKWIIIATVVAVLGGGSYYGYSYFKGEEVTEEKPEEKPNFPTAPVERGDVKKTINSAGTVEAKAREEVKPELSGKVQRVLVKEGQSVKKGDVLFTIDSSDAQLEIQKLELDILKAKKELSEIKQKKDKITATKEGKVVEVLVEEGQDVRPEQVVVKLANTDYLKIIGQFTSYESERFSVGQKVKVFIPTSMYFVDGVVTEVDRIGEKVEGAGGIHNVEVLVKKPGAIYVGDKGVVQYTDDKGLLYVSRNQKEFQLPDEIEILAGTHGKIGKVDVKKDDVVKVGQQLFKMDMEASGMELMEKELGLKTSLLNMEQKKREIAKNQVTAPISGVITKLGVKEGEAPGSEPAAIIMDTTSVYFMAAVGELDIPAIKIGQNVDVYVYAFGTEPFKGKVVELPKEGKKEEKEVRFAVKVELLDKADFKHGMTGDNDIIVAQAQNVLRLPSNAVEILGPGQGTVMVKDPSTGDPMPKDVEIGIEGYDFIEIKGGLKEGEEVLVTNSEGM